MEAVVALLFAASVLLGGIGVFFLIVVQPVWGIVDVATSDRHAGGTKAAIILLTLLLLGPIMTFFYACFGACSSALRRSTLMALGVLAVAGISAFAMAIAAPAGKNRWGPASRAPRFAEGTGIQTTETDEPPAARPVPAGEIAPFTALHLLPREPWGWSACIAEFTGYGPKPDSTIPLVLPSIYPVTHLAVDAEGPIYYAISTHEVGRIAPSTGQFVQLKPDPALGKLGWPSAIAYDPKQHLLLIVARSQGYSYNPATGGWKVLPGLKDDNIAALAYAKDEEVLYALRTRHGGELATHIVKLSPNGARLAEVGLSSPVAVGRYPFVLAQLCWSGRQLIVLVSPPERSETEPRRPARPAMYRLDPASGLCRPIDPKAPVLLEDESVSPH